MPKCEKFVKAYEACAERIKGDETGEAHCTVRCDAMRARARGRGGCVRGDSSARGVTTDAGTTTIRRRRDNTLTCTRAWTSAPRRKSWREPRDAARAYNITYSLTHRRRPRSYRRFLRYTLALIQRYLDKYCSLGYARLSTLDSSTTRTRSFLFPSLFTRRRRISSPTPLPFVSIAAARAAAAAAAPRRTHPSRTRRCTSRTTVSSSTARRERRKTPRVTRARVSSRAGVAHRARARTRWMFSRRSRARARASG